MKPRIIQFEYRKPSQCGGEVTAMLFGLAKRVPMFLTEEEAEDTQRLIVVHRRMFNEEWVNMMFIVIPNGMFLPVPMSHYNA